MCCLGDIKRGQSTKRNGLFLKESHNSIYCGRQSITKNHIRLCDKYLKRTWKRIEFKSQIRSWLLLGHRKGCVKDMNLKERKLNTLLYHSKRLKNHSKIVIY